MGRLATLQLIERVAADFASLDRRLAVGSQVLAGTDIVVDAEANLRATVAHETEGPNPVCDEEAGGVVGGRLAGGGAEANGGEESTGLVSFVVGSAHD